MRYENIYYSFGFFFLMFGKLERFEKSYWEISQESPLKKENFGFFLTIRTEKNLFQESFSRETVNEFPELPKEFFEDLRKTRGIFFPEIHERFFKEIHERFSKEILRGIFENVEKIQFQKGDFAHVNEGMKMFIIHSGYVFMFSECKKIFKICYLQFYYTQQGVINITKRSIN